VHTACFDCFICALNGRSKKGGNALEDVAPVPSTQQNLSNLYSLDIYVRGPPKVNKAECPTHIW
jgi:hypothetical protein